MPKFPKENLDILNNSLKNIYDRYKNRRSVYQKLNFNFDIELREVFMRSMIILLNDYRSYTINIDEIPLIDIENFIEKRSVTDKEFMREFLQTKNFRQFLQMAMTDYGKEWNSYFDKESAKYLLEKTSRKSCTIDTITRMSQILNLGDIISLQNLSVKEEDYPSQSEVGKQAVLYPYFLSDEFVTSAKEINNYYKKISQSRKTLKEINNTKVFLTDINIFEKLFKTPIEFIRKYKSIKRNPNERRNFKLNTNTLIAKNVTDENFKNLDVTKRLKLIKGRVISQNKEDEESMKTDSVLKQSSKKYS